MNLLNKIRRRLVSLLRSDRLDRDMDEELRFHLENQIEDNIKSEDPIGRTSSSSS